MASLWNEKPLRDGTITVISDDVPQWIREAMQATMKDRSLFGAALPLVDVTLKRVRVSQINVKPNLYGERTDVEFLIEWDATDFERSV